MKYHTLALVFFLLGLVNCRTPAENAALVKDQFVHGYLAYERYAYGHDELLPLTRSYVDYNPQSLLYTPIDALDTMYIMKLDMAKRVTQQVCALSFDQDMDVSVFDMVIRLLGGLLSSYYQSGEQCLLNQAIDLGNRIIPALTTPSLSGMSWPTINLHTGAVSGDSTNPAVVGTQIIEFGALSYATGNMTYYNAAKVVLENLYNSKSPLGLVGQCINVNTTSDFTSSNFWCSTDSHIDAQIDSYYEYQIKAWKLFGDTEFEQMWLASNTSIQQYLAYPKPNQLWYQRVNMFTGTNTTDGSAYQYDLYACFFAAALSLSGDMTHAIYNQESNWFMWQQYNVEGDTFNFGNDRYIGSTYSLNPENFESNYYLYHYTANQTYYSRAEIYLDDLIQYCRCNITEDCAGYSGLDNIETKIRANTTPSYFFAESLKYLYLTFLEFQSDSPLQFTDYIFNTEAHPIPISAIQNFKNNIQKLV